MIRTELSLVTVLLCGFGLWMAGTFVVCLIRGIVWHKRNRRSLVLRPKIHEALIEFLAGTNNQALLREFQQVSREDVAATILSFEPTVAGSARDRLCELALDLTLVHDWCEETRSKNAIVRRTAFARLCFVCHYEPCRRLAGDLMIRGLKIHDDEVNLSASRALIQSGALEDVERVFEHTVAGNPLVRILLTEEFRKHAVGLCRRAIPKELKTGDPMRILNMLRMATAWERALPMPGMEGLLNAPDREVRLQALRLASLVTDAPEIRNGILNALTDADPEIVGCAAGAAGRKHLESALPALARCLRLGSPDLARAAAAALAEMPPHGWETLQELTASSNEITALAAHEALARAKVSG